MLLLLEIVSVLMVLTYLYFAVKRNAIAWIFGLLASVLSSLLFFQQNLYGSMMLNVIYGLQAIMGYWHWKWLQPDRRPAFRTNLTTHLALVLFCFIASFALIKYLNNAGFREFIYWDLLLAFGSITATFLEIRKDTACWIYWIICNAAYSLLYLTTAGSMMLYAFLMLFLSVFSGFALKTWMRSESDE